MLNSVAKLECGLPGAALELGAPCSSAVATCGVLNVISPVARKLPGAPASRFFNGGDAGHGVVGSAKLRHALKLTVLVRGFACESARSAAPT